MVLLLCYFVDTLILWYFDTLLILWYFDTLIFCWYFDTLMTLSSVLILCWNLNLEFSAWHLFYWNLILEVNSCLRFLRHWISARFQWRRSGLLSLNFWDIVPELINWYWIIQHLPIIWIITYNIDLNHLFTSKRDFNNSLPFIRILPYLLLVIILCGSHLVW